MHRVAPNAPSAVQAGLCMADFMRGAKGNVMVSINDHPYIRACFEGFQTQRIDFSFSVGNARRTSKRPISSELVITSWDTDQSCGLF
ncbi:DNA adenine methylase [Roseateles sp. YR242]|nr:DNA adenine methylase [Roseateles sp. YR242]